MPNQIPNVRTWSKNVPEYLFDVGDLDVYVLKEHDEIVRAMGRSRGGPSTGQIGAAAILLGILVPVIAVTLWSGGRLKSGAEVEGLEGSLAAVITGLLFVLSVPVPPLVAWQWWRCQRHRDGLEVGALVVCLGAGSLILSLMSRADVDVFGPALLSVPVWVTVIGAGVVLVPILVASRGPRPEFELHFRVTGPMDPDAVRRLLDDLEPRQLEKMGEGRRSAIGRLRDRGLIDDRQADELRSSPLGSSPTLGTPER